MEALHYNFNPVKAGQAAAFLLSLSKGKNTKGHLVKMLYASDWSSLRKTGSPITGDQPVSMPQGPVLSEVLHFLDGEKTHPFWKKHLSTAPKRSGNSSITLLKPSEYDLLTENDKKTLCKVHAHFSNRSWPEVKKECYRIFKEWSDPKGSQKKIRFEDMLTKSGKKSQAFVDDLISIQQEKVALKALFA